MKLNIGTNVNDLLIERDLKLLCTKLHNNIRQDPYGKIEVTVAHEKFPSRANDIVGKCVEEWISHWFRKNNVIHNLRLFPNTESQEFPDYKAVIGHQVHPMDIKCFNDRTKTGKPNEPAFDIGNFDSFFSKNDDLIKPKLLADYLVFAYHPITTGFVFDDVKRMRIWNMVGIYHSKGSKYQKLYNSARNQLIKYPKLYNNLQKMDLQLAGRAMPISLQVKKGQPYAVRPMNFESKRSLATQSGFQSPSNLLKKMTETRCIFKSKSNNIYNPITWLQKMSQEIGPYVQFLRNNNLI